MMNLAPIYLLFVLLHLQKSVIGVAPGFINLFARKLSVFINQSRTDFYIKFSNQVKHLQNEKTSKDAHLDSHRSANKLLEVDKDVSFTRNLEIENQKALGSKIKSPVSK